MQMGSRVVWLCGVLEFLSVIPVHPTIYLDAESGMEDTYAAWCRFYDPNHVFRTGNGADWLHTFGVWTGDPQRLGDIQSESGMYGVPYGSD